MKRSSNLAKNALAAVLTTVLLLFYIYPATTLYSSTNPFPTTIFVQHPEELTPPITSPNPITYLEHLPPLQRRSTLSGDNGDDCNTLDSGGARTYCEVSRCIAFYGLFEFWYPGCEVLINDYTVNDLDGLQALAYLDVSHCIAFFELFEFWYPGCKDLVEDLTPFSVSDSDDQDESPSNVSMSPKRSDRMSVC